MCEETDGQKSPDVYVITGPSEADAVDTAAACFAAMLEKFGYEIKVKDKFKGGGFIRAMAPCGLALDFNVYPESKVIRIAHHWPLDGIIRTDNPGLRRALDQANADSWWNNYTLDKDGRIVNVTSYITLSQGFYTQEIMEFLDRQLKAFFEEAKETRLASFFERCLKRAR